MEGVLAVLLFAAVHLAGPRLSFLRTVPRSLWLSAAGGVSVAYVFVHLLPELAAQQRAFSGGDGWLSAVEHHVWLLALAGLAAFYGLERLARRAMRAARAAGRAAAPAAVFRLHLTSFALYNLLIGYLLLHREEPGVRSLLLYTSAMALHFVVNDQGLRELYGTGYDRRGRWLLAAAPATGWLIGLVIDLPQRLLAALFALLAGAVVLNVLKEELPEDRDSRFSAFALGAACYAALLLATA